MALGLPRGGGAGEEAVLQGFWRTCLLEETAHPACPPSPACSAAQRLPCPQEKNGSSLGSLPISWALAKGAKKGADVSCIPKPAGTAGRLSSPYPGSQKRHRDFTGLPTPDILHPPTVFAPYVSPLPRAPTFSAPSSEESIGYN